jgi:hypothetical protein
MKHLKSILVCSVMISFSFLVISSCKPKAGNESTTESSVNQSVNEEDGWIVLFDGTSTAGWRGYAKDSFPQQGWIIEDNSLKCLASGKGEAGGKGGDIIYDRKFKDFHLKLEWKISEGGNSGILYLAQEKQGQSIWKSAPEMQVLDNAKHPDSMLGKDGNRKAGSLYDILPADPQNSKPAGEWNEVEIMVYQGTVIHKMNGEVVVEYHLGTPEWAEMVANSKFKEYPDFGQYVEGYIGLQDHGNNVWYRNIKIKDLSI